MNYSVHTLGDQYARKVIAIINRQFEEDECSLIPGALPVQYYAVIQKSSGGLPGYVLTDDERVVGIGYCTPYHEAASLKSTVELHCHVHRDYLRNGLGSVLLEAIAANLPKIGVGSLIARLPSTNSAGAAFLLKNGFTVCASIPDLVCGSDEPVDLIYMLRRLPEIKPD